MKSRLRPLTCYLTVLLFSCSCLAGGTPREVTPSTSGMPGTAEPSDQGDSKTAPSLTIPGPPRSFLRMAAVSQKASPEEVLPLLARKVAMEGYGSGGKPTEYLVLLKRYVEQARELVALAGREGVIRVSSCSDAQPLLGILGYRLQPGCGPDASVEVAHPERAFVTIDSGFPLTDLEDTLRGGKPFAYPFPASPVPILFGRGYWALNAKDKKSSEDVLDWILRDPALSRLYWAIAQIDAKTGIFLLHSVGLDKLLPLAPVLDFYGRDRKSVV